MAVSPNTPSILYLADQRNQMIITIFWTNSTVSDHVIRHNVALICYLLQGDGVFLHFGCFICWGKSRGKMHGVGMQEKRARVVVSSARWSHGRPMDWDGLEDSQAFWATSGRNTYLCVASHSFSLEFFNATMHFALYYYVKKSYVQMYHQVAEHCKLVQ